MARRRRTTNVVLSRRGDTYHVCHGQVELEAHEVGALHTVTRAQTLALNSPVPIELFVQRRSLFGPSAMLYRVVRPDDEDAVLTYTLSPED